mgnify:CR=1 FL=1
MLKNFVIKVMSWSDFVFPELFCSWNERVSPKFIYYITTGVGWLTVLGAGCLLFSVPLFLCEFLCGIEILILYYCVRIEGEEQSYDTDQVIKYNTYQDLALIRIERSCKPIPIYNGKKPLVRGQKVVAIGSPISL